MALGKNMKVDRLIPLKKEDKVNVEPSPLNEDLKGENLSQEADQEVVESEVTPAVSVSLDEFFENLSPATTTENILEEPAKPAELKPENSENVDQAISYEDVLLEDLTLMFKPSRRKTQRRMIINLEGNLTIKHVDLLYSKVHSVFENYDIAEINLTNITDIDITVIQLFHAIRVHFFPMDKFITIQADLSREDRKLLNTCGFTEFQS
jgi:hypothetical protein